MSIAAEPRQRAARARAWAGRAVAWWLGELAALYRDTARAFGAGEHAAITIEAGERYWTVRHRQRVTGQIDRSLLDSAESAAALTDAVPAALRGRAVQIEIPPERVLSKTINFPAGARTELDRILDFEIARHFPFPAARVFYRHRIVRQERGSSLAPLAVEIVAVPREVVAGIRAEIVAAGLRPGPIALIGGGDAEPLWLAAEALGRAPAAHAAHPLLVTAVGVLAAAAVLSWPLAQHWRLASLDRELAALKPRAEAVLQRRERIRSETRRVTGLIRLRSSRPPLVGVLDLLTRAVPDGSYLLSLSVSGRELVIDGLSPSAATIALALQRSGVFDGIDFRAPITRETGGLEHFQIGATIGKGKK